MQACGHMYLDEGEELSTGIARDNLLSFSASTAAGGSSNSTAGQVTMPPLVHLQRTTSMLVAISDLVSVFVRDFACGVHVC